MEGDIREGHACPPLPLRINITQTGEATSMQSMSISTVLGRLISVSAVSCTSRLLSIHSSNLECHETHLITCAFLNPSFRHSQWHTSAVALSILQK
jgi:hypothetical protein